MAGEELAWTEPDWLAEVRAWIDERVEVTGEVEQPHVRPWATALRLPTADGTLWFKAVAHTQAFEPALTRLLASLRPDRVTELVDADEERGWMLMRDAGTRLREVPASVEHFEQALPLYAEVQIAAAPAVERMVEVGVPDVRLPAFVRQVHSLAASHPELEPHLAEVEALVAELQAAGIPESVQHDDLHDGQIFVRDGHYRVLDWGDSCVSHPFHSLTVTLRAGAWKLGLPPGSPELVRMRDAYLEPFGSARGALPPRGGRLPDGHAWSRARVPALYRLAGAAGRGGRRGGSVRDPALHRKQTDRHLGIVYSPFRTIPMRSISLLFSSLAIVFSVAVTGAAGARTDAAGEIRSLVTELELRHPNAYHSVSRNDFHRAADELAARAPGLRRDQLIVGVMRLTAMLGERDGHSGVFPLSPVPGQSLRAYPLRLHRFTDGLYVTQADDQSLVGARLAAVGGVTAEEVEARVRPLITRDNEWTVLDRLPFFVVTAEVLGGLDIAPTFSFALRGGGTRDLTMQPISVAQHIEQFGGWWQPTTRPGPQPLYLRRKGLMYGVMTINRGRAVYVTYNTVTNPGSMPQRLLKLARKPRVRRVIVDLRINGGGDNTTYWSLVRGLQNRRINKRGKLAVLIGRRTFSAAGNLAGDLDSQTRARFFGEPTGGAPSQWGDQAVIPLPSLRISAATAVEYVGDPDDTRTATMPDVPVPVSAAAFFAGRDPVLAAALR